MEMIEFVKVFYPGGKKETFFESCGVADLITTCYGLYYTFTLFFSDFRILTIWLIQTGGRNRKVSEAYVTSGKTIEQLETEMLNGQKLQGPITAKEVNYMLQNKKMEDKWAIQFWFSSILIPFTLLVYLLFFICLFFFSLILHTFI